MKNIDQPSVQNVIKKGLWEAIDYGDALNTADEAISLIKRTFESLPEEFKEVVNKTNLSRINCIEYTVEITTKKKGKIIWTEYHNQDKIGQIIEIEPRKKQFLHFKQLVHGRFYDDESFYEGEKYLYVDNVRPSKFCCDGLKNQFKFCETHGMNCPDNFVTANAEGELYIKAVNATYGLIFCPFCGVQHDKDYKKE